MSDSTGLTSLEHPHTTPANGQGSHPLGAFVAELKPHAGSSTLQTRLAIGKLVLDHFYGGCLERFQTLGTRHVSFRKLADVPGLPVSGLVLYRSVCLYDVFHRHQAWRYRHNGMSHFRAVIGLEHALQAQLLERSEQAKWTVNRLQHEASVLRAEPDSPGRGVRAPRPAFVKALKGLRNYAEPEHHAFADLDRAAELDPVAARELESLARSLSARFAAVAERLSRVGR